jgi:DNA end-binding protein Ku
MAEQLIDSLSAAFEPSKFHDEYREQVLNMIERKAAGEEIAVQPQAEEPEAAPDLMAALEASLAAMRGDEPAAKPRRRESAKSADGAGGGKSRGKAKAKT